MKLPFSSQNNRVNIDLRILTVLLLVAVVVMLALWRPWQDSQVSDRTIEVTGEAVVSAEPDEYAFYPVYRFQHDDRQAAIDEMSAKSDELVAKLKELGVEESQIKTDANGYERGEAFPEPDGDTRTTYTLSLTVTVPSRELAQKVQNYLADTGPTGAVSPRATFSEDKRKELESEARNEATKDARTKADQTAENLGFKVGAVKSVTDGAGFGGGPITFEARALDTSASSDLSIEPGENELRYSVTVTYYVR